MRRVIHGRVYDTDTATRVAGRSSGIIGQPEFIDETLYYVEGGHFFVAGQGGAGTPYGIGHDSEPYFVGEDVIPATADQARAWLEQAGLADKVERYFGPADKGQGLEVYRLFLPRSLAEAVERQAAAAGVSPRAWMVRVVERAAADKREVTRERPPARSHQRKLSA